MTLPSVNSVARKMSIDFGELCRAKESRTTQSLLDDLHVMSGVLVTSSPFAAHNLLLIRPPVASFGL